MVGDLGRWPLGAERRRRGRRWGSPVVVALTLCVWVLLVGAQPAGAHPELTGVGATAGQVRVTFSTPLEEAFLRLVVREGDGRVISGVAVRDARDPRAAVVALERPATAAAVVVWRVLGEDGHPATGAASVAGILTGGDQADEGRAGANGAPMLTARVLTLIGPLALGGMLVLVIGVLLPVLRVGGLRPPGGGQREAERVRAAVGEAVAAVAGAWRRAAAVGLVAWAVGLLMSPLALLWALRGFPNLKVSQGAIQAGQDPQVLPPLLITSQLEPAPALSGSYRGQDFTWWVYPGWAGPLPDRLSPWTVSREAPLTTEKIILWARSDLFPGSAP